MFVLSEETILDNHRLAAQLLTHAPLFWRVLAHNASQELTTTFQNKIHISFIARGAR